MGNKIYFAVQITNEDGEFRVDTLGWSADERKLNTFIDTRRRFLSSNQQIDIFDAEEVV